MMSLNSLSALTLSTPFSIFQLPIMKSVCPQVLHKLLLWNTLGNMQTSQEHFPTIAYAKFGGKQSALWGIGK